MTHLCYTLDEAAERLKLSETVLVRLSQYFKVPKAAYDEVGYLSFKGDLAFSEQDINFFRQIKEHVLAGESLDEVSRRVRQEPEPAGYRPLSPNPQPGYQSPRHQAPQAATSPQRQSETPPPPVTPPQAPLRQIPDRAPYQKAAEQSFERYKSKHRTGLVKVFENMLKEVGVSHDAKEQKPHPQFRPFRNKVAPQTPSRPEASSNQPSIPPSRPMSHTAEGGTFQPAPTPVNTGLRAPKTPKSHTAKTDTQDALGQLLQQNSHHPRTMNSHLRNAALLLRQRALNPDIPEQDAR